MLEVDKEFLKIMTTELHEDFRPRNSPRIGFKINLFPANSLIRISAQRESYENLTKLGD